MRSSTAAADCGSGAGSHWLLQTRECQIEVIGAGLSTLNGSGRGLRRAEFSVVFADEDGGAEDGGPEAALVADRGLRDVEGADDLVGDAIDLFFLVPGKIRVKFHVKGGREHFRGELLGIFAGDFLSLSERGMLGKIAVHRFIARKREADAGSDEAMRFLGGIFADDRERYLAGPDVLQSFAARDQFAIRREDIANPHHLPTSKPPVPYPERPSGRS